MGDHSGCIQITVRTNYNEQLVKVLAGSYRNLMYLINDRVYADGFGQCGGMGRCGTCMVEILKHHTPLESLDRNESSTLEKMGISSPDIRLSCQMLVTADLDGIELKIIEP